MNNFSRCVVIFCTAFFWLWLLFLRTAYANTWLNTSIGGGINYFMPNTSSIAVRHAAHPSFAGSIGLSHFFNQHIGIAIGYTHFGFYENAGSGFANCDMQGRCNYPSPNGINVYNTYVNVNNEITSQSFYLTGLFSYTLTSRLTLIAQIGGAYNITKIRSYVTVNPEFINKLPVGFIISQRQTSENKQALQPYMSVGWQYPIDYNMVLTSLFVWGGVIKIYRDNQLTGKLIPGAVMLGISYRL